LDLDLDFLFPWGFTQRRGVLGGVHGGE
jgi:hypothetical protein